MLPYHTVLCPLDFSESSYKAPHSAAEIASHFQADLLLLHVLPVVLGIPAAPAFLEGSIPGMPADPANVLEVPKGYQQEQEVAAEERLTIATKLLPSEIKLRTAIGTGDAADEIVRLATKESADLIVIATHGTTGWRHLVFGSVTEKVIRLARQPVLVIPAHDSEAVEVAP